MNIKEYLKSEEAVFAIYLPAVLLVVTVIMLIYSTVIKKDPTIESRTKSVKKNLAIVCLDGITYWNYAHTYSSTITLKVDINGKPIPCKLVE